MSQIALPLTIGPAGGPARIVVGTANAGVVEAFGATANWPFRTAVVQGLARSGKSLLARWFVENGLGDAVDDADLLDETALFHRWNRAQEAATPLLLTVAAREGGWQVALPDLASRLGAALLLEIGAPDDAMMADLIAAHAEALAVRATRSHMGAERLVAEIDRLSLERKVAPGLAIWREALVKLSGISQPRLL